MAERSTVGKSNIEQHQQAPESVALEKEMKQKGRAKASLQKSVPYYKLFSHADGWDYLLMIVGGLAAIAHGVSIPVFYIFLGKLVNSLGSTVTNPARGLQMGREVSKVLCLKLNRFALAVRPLLLVLKLRPIGLRVA